MRAPGIDKQRDMPSAGYKCLPTYQSCLVWTMYIVATDGVDDSAYHNPKYASSQLDQLITQSVWKFRQSMLHAPSSFVFRP